MREFLGDGPTAVFLKALRELPKPVLVGTRRAWHATILFTDIVGHTEMMQRLGDAKRPRRAARARAHHARDAQGARRRRSEDRWATASWRRSAASRRRWSARSRCSARSPRTPSRCLSRCTCASASTPASRSRKTATSSARRSSSRRASPRRRARARSSCRNRARPALRQRLRVRRPRRVRAQGLRRRRAAVGSAVAGVIDKQQGSSKGSDSTESLPS